MSSTADAGPRRPGRRAQAACEVARNRHYDGATVQRQRLLSLVAVIGGSVTAGFGVMQLMFSDSFGYLGLSTLAPPPSMRSSRCCIDSVSWSRHSL